MYVNVQSDRWMYIFVYSRRLTASCYTFPKYRDGGIISVGVGVISRTRQSANMCGCSGFRATNTTLRTYVIFSSSNSINRHSTTDHVHWGIPVDTVGDSCTLLSRDTFHGLHIIRNRGGVLLGSCDLHQGISLKDCFRDKIRRHTVCTLVLLRYYMDDDHDDRYTGGCTF